MSRQFFSSAQSRDQQAALPPAKAAPEQWATEGTNTATPIRPLHVLILGGLSALGPLSTDMYLPALPTISQDLGGTMSQTQLTLSAGILGLALGSVIAGPISGSPAVTCRRPAPRMS